MSVLAPPGASRRSGLLGALVIAAAGFLLHLPSLDHAPVLDDATLLSDAAAAESAGELFGRGLFGGVRGYGGYYRPLTALSFRAEAALGVGLRGAHVTNALLHALVAVAAFVLLRRLLGGLFVPFASALLFAVHPVHVDAVDPVTGRGDLLAAAFLLLAWVAFHVRRQGAPGGAIALAVSALLFAAGLLSKESAAVLPALVVAGEWVARRGQRKAMARRPGDYAVLLAVVAVYLALRTAILGGLIEPGLPDRLDNPLAGAGLAARMGTAPVAWLEMARLLLWPWPFSPDYSGGALELPSGPLDPRVLGGWVLALTLLGAWLWTGRRTR